MLSNISSTCLVLFLQRHCGSVSEAVALDAIPTAEAVYLHAYDDMQRLLKKIENHFS
jgi:hypothetical protein